MLQHMSQKFGTSRGKEFHASMGPSSSAVVLDSLKEIS